MTAKPDALIPFPLTQFDRCDRCSAIALMRARLRVGELLFCGHHARVHRSGLLAVGALLNPDL